LKNLSFFLILTKALKQPDNKMFKSRTIARKVEIVRLTEKLHEAMNKGDFETYRSLCTTDHTCFDPAIVTGHLMTGLDYQKFHFDSGFLNYLCFTNKLSCTFMLILLVCKLFFQFHLVNTY